MNEYSFINFSFGLEEVLINTKAKTGEKYHRILEAAVKVFAEKGFHQSTIAQIAKEAGVADGTIYLYFKNKDDILVQFFQYKTKQVFGGFREEVNKADTAVDKLRNLVHRHLSEFQRDRDMAIVYQSFSHHKNDLIEGHIREMSKMYLDIVSEVVELGQQEGSMRKELYVGLVKRFILGAVESAINNWLRSRREYDLTAMADPLIDLFIRGIGTGGAAPHDHS